MVTLWVKVGTLPAQYMVANRMPKKPGEKLWVRKQGSIHEHKITCIVDAITEYANIKLYRLSKM